MTDDELEALHGDDPQHSIAKWRKEMKSGRTNLDYVDWRCDRIWCAAKKRRRYRPNPPKEGAKA